MGYKLYVNEDELILRIEPAGNLLMIEEFPDIPKYFNERYMICNNRKALREEAKLIKQRWESETETKLESIRNLKITNKY